MAKKPKRPSRFGQGQKPPQDKAFFSAENARTERDGHTYKFPGVPEIKRVLIACNGNLTAAAAELNVVRNTVFKWVAEYPELAEARIEGNQRRLDRAESKLDELIEGVQVQKMTPDGPDVYTLPPHFKSIEFLLRTLGKDRGYIADNKPTQANSSASLWVQLHGLMEQARQAYDTQDTQPPEPGTVAVSEGIDSEAELGSRPGEIG